MFIRFAVKPTIEAQLTQSRTFIPNIFADTAMSILKKANDNINNNINNTNNNNNPLSSSTERDKVTPTGTNTPFSSSNVNILNNKNNSNKDNDTKSPNMTNVRCHQEHCVLGWPPADIYRVVADVNRYEEFLPWCTSSIVTSHNGREIAEGMKAAGHNNNNNNNNNTNSSTVVLPSPSVPADHYHVATKMESTLSVGFSFIKEQYTSEVELVPYTSIIANLKGESTLLRSLQCRWSFLPINNNNNNNIPIWEDKAIQATEIDFLVSFEFRNPLHTSLSSLVMSNVVHVMTSSFEERCSHMYGPPSSDKVALPLRSGAWHSVSFSQHMQHHAGGIAERLESMFVTSNTRK